ncbi:MAG: DNA-binding protein [Pseudonocardiaceae bacterium]|nr:DNA-binding protein [Pseudonocardiaceae bacterium]
MDAERIDVDREHGSVARPALRRREVSHYRRRVAEAWERFASGEDDVRGIPSPVLLSWHRCRDVYQIDPRLSGAPRATYHGNHPPLHNGIFAQLGGIATTIVERSENCLATVTDGDGRILASWGAGLTMRKAAENNLSPSFAWSESAVGTNGMGTALAEHRPLSVRGPEHWCHALHSWDCMGVAVYDWVTQHPIAALNVSSWKQEVPLLESALNARIQPVRQGLRERALRDAVEVARAFVQADRHTRGALIAIDVAGSVIAANDTARILLNDLPEEFRIDPAGRWRSGHEELSEIARKSALRIECQSRCASAADLGFLFGRHDQMFDVAPVISADGVIGLLLSNEHLCDDAEVINSDPDARSAPALPRRIPAVQGGRMLLLLPEEIRYAEAARHDVWLMTDQGRLRALTQGIDNVQRELEPLGFMRVHRSFVVNVSRISEVSHCGKGMLSISTDLRKNEAIPVSRSWAPKLRGQLGL